MSRYIEDEDRKIQEEESRRKDEEAEQNAQDYAEADSSDEGNAANKFRNSMDGDDPENDDENKDEKSAKDKAEDAKDAKDKLDDVKDKVNEAQNNAQTPDASKTSAGTETGADAGIGGSETGATGGANAEGAAEGAQGVDVGAGTSESAAGNTGAGAAETGGSAAAETGTAAAETGTAGAEAAAAEAGTAEAAGAAGAAEAGGTAAAAGAAEAGGTAAAAGSTAAGAGTAAAGVAGAPILLIVLLVILVIIILIGTAAYFQTMPQFLFNKFKDFASSVWDGLAGYVIGMDEVLVKDEQIKGTAQYLSDMGYDLVGMGFAEDVTYYTEEDAENDEEVVEGQIADIDAPYLKVYLIAENRTYLINNYTFNVQDILGSFYDLSFFKRGSETWGTGLIDIEQGLLERIFPNNSGPLGIAADFLDDIFTTAGSFVKSVRIGHFNVGEFVDGVKIDRETNQMRIRRVNWDGLSTRKDYTYFSLEGWTGRYGKPFELSLTLHIATMAPDLVEEFDMAPETDAKVHLKLMDTKITGELTVDGKTYSEIVEEQNQNKKLKEEADKQAKEAEENGVEIENPITYGTIYSDETMNWLSSKNSDVKDIETSIPYISSVTNHWFRNVYFEGANSSSANNKVEIGIDDDSDGIEDYEDSTSGMQKTQKTRKLSTSDNVYEDTKGEEVTLPYDIDDIPSELSGAEITISGTYGKGITQTKDAVRGVTNQYTKDLFSKKYYIYDGTEERAREIQKLREAGNGDEGKNYIKMTQESLQAFTILEEANSLDAQFIYRDLKELVIELGYFDREDFYVVEQQILEWPIPDYVPAEWPSRDYEKDVIEYGTLIASDETTAYSLGMTLEELQKLTGIYSEEETEETEEVQIENEKLLKQYSGMTVIGDEYAQKIKNTINVDKVDYEITESDGASQYWLDHIDELPENMNKVLIITGVNDPKNYTSGVGLIDALNEKYDEKLKIYVVGALHVGKDYTDADEYNKLIDTYNSHLQNKCKRTSNAKYIDTSIKFLKNGYLIESDSSNKRLADSRIEAWAIEIINKINDNRNQSSNQVDESFAVDLIKSAKQVSETIKKNEYTYGTGDFIPPQVNEKVNEENGFTDEEGTKREINTAQLISWALYKSGYKDVPSGGLSVGEDGTLANYLIGKEWLEITDQEEIVPGDIVFTGKIETDDNEKRAAQHAYLYAGDGKYYDIDSQEKIDMTGSYQNENGTSGEQPIAKTISDFAFAYRATGDGLISTGFEKGLDVIAPANGLVTEILNEENNLYTTNYLATALYGQNASTSAEDEVPGRTQSYDGIRLKLSDNALRGYVLIMYGFELDGVSAGDSIEAGDIIGKTLDSDIALILIDRDKAICENVENYFKVPKKVKTSAEIDDWELFYWLPFESGAADTVESYKPGRYTGPVSVGTCSAGETAFGIVQWTSLTSSGMSNQRDQFLPFFKENYPEFYRKLAFMENWGAEDYWNDYNGANAAQAALKACDDMDHDGFLKAQMECAKANYLEPLLEEHPWLESRPSCVQGEVLHLKLWGASLADLDSVQSKSDKDVILYVRHKIANTNSTAAAATGDETSGRAFNEPEIGLAILDGRLDSSEVEQWVRNQDYSVLTSNGVAMNGENTN